MLTKNEVCTLVNIVIVNPTCANLLPQFCTTQRFVASDVAQAKKKVTMTDTHQSNLPSSN
jgi:hypothetical protein